MLADLLTITMIRSFRERPLALFAIGALAAASVAVLFATAAVLAMWGFGPDKASAVVLPGAAMLWLGRREFSD